MTKKVVIVDDDEDLLRLIGTSFRSKGFEVIEFKDGHSAEEFLFNEQNAKEISLLILDRLLPDTDGLKLLQQINQKYSPPYPVLFLSTLSSEKDVVQGLSQGAVDYIAKPFNMNILMQKATQLIK